MKTLLVPTFATALVLAASASFAQSASVDSTIDVCAAGIGAVCETPDMQMASSDADFSDDTGDMDHNDGGDDDAGDDDGGDNDDGGSDDAN